MLSTSKRYVRTSILATVALLSGSAFAQDAIRVVAQKTGTFAWELDVIRAHGLDKQARLAIETMELASPEAGKIALRGGSADIVVSDWTWVSRERTLGARLVFHPYSSALGAIMVSQASPIVNLSDLRGRKLAVAGGPIDKSWLFLRAALMRDGVDLKTQSTVVYGAPTLLAEKTAARRIRCNPQLLEYLRGPGGARLAPDREYCGPASETRRHRTSGHDRLCVR